MNCLAGLGWGCDDTFLPWFFFLVFDLLAIIGLWEDARLLPNDFNEIF